MIPPEELRHLIEGPRPGEMPAGAGLVEILGWTPGDAEIVASRCRAVLVAILEANAASWPSKEVWQNTLPAWFVEGCAPEQPAEEDAAWLARWRRLSPEARAQAGREKAWSLADWLYWMHPEERTWYWWDAVAGAAELRVLLEVPAWPAPTGACEWLLRVAGASSVEVRDSPTGAF